MTEERDLRVLVWNEGVHETLNEPAHISCIYPNGIHGAIGSGLRSHWPSAEIRTATLDTADDHGLTEESLAATDVLIWWGHLAHERISDKVAERLQRHVLGGMGLVVLHSGHFAKVFTRLLGTSCSLSWRNEGE